MSEINPFVEAECWMRQNGLSDLFAAFGKWRYFVCVSCTQKMVTAALASRIHVSLAARVGCFAQPLWDVARRTGWLHLVLANGPEESYFRVEHRPFP